MNKKLLHVGYTIENLLVLFEEFNEKAKELKSNKKNPINIRGQFAVSHINNYKQTNTTGTYKFQKSEEEISKTIPSETTGEVVSYCIINDLENQGPFIGICIKCINKIFYAVLYDNGKNHLYTCITHMKNNPKKFNSKKKKKKN